MVMVWKEDDSSTPRAWDARSLSHKRPGSHPPSAVVFDCDGLLLDTSSTWETAERHVVAAHGGTWTSETRQQVHGVSLLQAAGVMSAHVADGADDKILLAEMLQAFAELIAERGMAPMPGVRELLDDLGNWCPLAVASNTPQPLLGLVLCIAEVADYFAVVVGASHNLASKPAPDIYQETCALLRTESATVHALEDSQAGITAALRAGLTVTGVSRNTALTNCAQVRSLHEISRTSLWIT